MPLEFQFLLPGFAGTVGVFNVSQADSLVGGKTTANEPVNMDDLAACPSPLERLNVICPKRANNKRNHVFLRAIIVLL